MYICTNCGKEYEEEAAFCMACGSPVVAKEEEAEVAAVAPVQEENRLLTLVGFINNLLNIASGFFMALAMMLTSYSASTSIYNSKVRVYVYSNPDETCAVFALLLAITAVAAAVFSFIFAMIKREPTKSKFCKITKMALSTLLFIASIVLLSV